MEKIVREGENTFRFGDWTIEAEMNPSRPAVLHIYNFKENTDFKYENGKAVMNK